MDSADKLIDLAEKQGVHVATIVLFLVLISAVVALWQKNNKMRQQFEDDMVAERSRHATEIAAERKLNADLQEARLLEMKSSVDAIHKVTVTIQNATDAVNTTLSIMQRSLS